MAFKTFAPGVLTSSDVNTFLMRQAVITCTSSTRPASPSEGMTIYETDNDVYRVYDGSNWQLLISNTQAYTPTSSITIGNGTLEARYAQLGNFYVVQFDFTWGSTTDWNGQSQLQITAPSTIGSFLDGFGSGTLRDASLGQTYKCTVRPITANDSIQLNLNQVSGSYIVGASMNATTPFTWAAGDQLWGFCIYWRP